MEKFRINLITGISNLVKGLISLPNSLIKVAADAYSELRQVKWLSPGQVARFSLYVLIFMIVSAVSVALLDLAFYDLLKLLTTR